MRFTTDTYTGKRYGWDEVVREAHTGLLTPAKGSDGSYLHPHRVPRELLVELNGRDSVCQCHHCEAGAHRVGTEPTTGNHRW